MPRKSKKSDAELRKNHVAKVEHAVRRVDMWYGKLEKGLKSRKYPMSGEAVAKALDYIQDKHDAFILNMTTTKGEASKFTLE